MNNTLQLYIDKEKEIKGYPITSPDRVIDENGISIKQQLDNIDKYIYYVNAIDLNLIEGADNTEKLQECLNDLQDNSILIIPNGVYKAKNLTLNSKKNITINILGTLKHTDDNTTTPSNILLIESCENINIYGKFDGNILNNIDNLNEFKHCLKISSSNNIEGEIECNNVTGDGVYITNSNYVYFKSVKCENTSYSGRNAVSIISGKNIRIDYLKSIKIGRNDMPGGIDLEPNHENETIDNVRIGLYEIDTIGTGSPVANIHGGTCKNIYIDTVNYKINDGCKSSSSFYLCGVSNVTINYLNIYGSLKNTNVLIDTCSNIVINNLNSTNGNYGLYLKDNDNIKVKGIIENIKSHGVEFTSSNSNIILDMVIKNCNCLDDGYGFAIRFSSSATLDNVKIMGDLSKYGNTMKGIHCDKANTINNVILENCKFNNYDSQAYILSNTLGGVLDKINCEGLTTSKNSPTAGTWKSGDIVKNTSSFNVIEDDTNNLFYYVEGWVYDGAKFREIKKYIK